MSEPSKVSFIGKDIGGFVAGPGFHIRAPEMKTTDLYKTKRF